MAKQLKKPEKKKIEILDYHECANFISNKLGYDLRDTLGKYKAEKLDIHLEYRDFWHFLVDKCNLSNGSSIYLPHPEEADQPWESEILEAFWEEFGKGPYLIEW